MALLKQWRTLLPIGAILVFWHAPMRAEDSFHVDRDPAGIVTTRVGMAKDNAYAVAVQADGKVLAAGASHTGSDLDIAVIRYLTDGSVDYSFGDGGVAVYGSELGDDKAYGMLLLPDGKFLVAGSTHNGKNTDFVVLRFYPNGRLDKSFGRNGVFRRDFGKGNDTAYSLFREPGGRILVAGSAANDKDLDFALLRLEENGRPDVAFGTLGSVVTRLGDINEKGANEFGYSVVEQSDGHILLSGYSEVDGASVIASIRYSNDGKIDDTFGAGGIVLTQVGGKRDRAYSSTVTPDGRLVVAGCASNGKNTRFALARYLPNGTPDLSFGDRGVVTTSVSNGDDIAYSVLLDAFGNYVVAGGFIRGHESGFALARYLPNGAPDLSFGESGKLTVMMDKQYTAAYAVALQPDGKIVGAGVSSHTSGAYQFAIARFQPNGVTDSSFGGAAQGTQLARTRGREAITAEVGLPGFVLPSGRANR